MKRIPAHLLIARDDSPAGDCYPCRDREGVLPSRLLIFSHPQRTARRNTTTLRRYSYPFFLIAGIVVSTPARSALAQSATQPTPRPFTRELSHGPVKVTLHLDRDEVTAPDTVTLTLRLEAEKGVEITGPDIGGALGDFLVTGTTEKPMMSNDSTQTIERVYTLAPVYDGRGEIPALIIHYKDAREKMDGSQEVVEGDLSTDGITLVVHQNLADLKGPLALPTAWPLRLLYWLVGLVLAVGLVVLVARWWRNTRSRNAFVAPLPVPAHVWALAELDMLDALGLIERGRVQEYYYRINAILREYVERRWGLMAAEQTSEEFLRELQRSLLLSDVHKAVLQRFIESCDPVKYARQQPTREDIRWVGETARQFVQSTIPQTETTSRAEAA